MCVCIFRQIQERELTEHGTIGFVSNFPPDCNEMPQCVQANFSLVSLLVFTPVNEWLVLLAVDNGQWGSLSWLSLFSLQNKTVHGGRKTNPLFTPLTLFLQSFILWCWVFMADRGPEAHSVGRAPMGATRNLLLVPTLTARNHSMPCWKVRGGLETGDVEHIGKAHPCLLREVRGCVATCEGFGCWSLAGASLLYFWANWAFVSSLFYI